MVRIRMRRTGSNKDIAYRVVVADMRSPRDGKCIETLGWYNPKQVGDNYQVKLDRIEYWRSKGAQISERAGRHTGRAGGSRAGDRGGNARGGSAGGHGGGAGHRVRS